MARRHKIALIGAGNIGGELAAVAARHELGDIVLFDIPGKGKLAKGEARDLAEGGGASGWEASLFGRRDVDDWPGARVGIVAAGRPPQTGRARGDPLL